MTFLPLCSPSHAGLPALGAGLAVKADEEQPATHTACDLVSIFRTSLIFPLIGEVARGAQERNGGSWDRAQHEPSQTQSPPAPPSRV